MNKKITDIQYNCLNLPSRIQFENGSTFSYLYDAAGTKLRVTHNIEGKTTTTDYCGNAIYENGVLQKLLTEQGYITLPDTTYHYFIQDHQGNNRVVVDQNGTVEEVNHYYPFGGVFASSQSVQPYKYNGKELDRSNGLDWYDYGARHYDAAIGRWHAGDPSSEKYYSWSPYVYCKNNPILRIDVDGREDYVVGGDGKLTKVGSGIKGVDRMFNFSGKEESPKGKNSVTVRKGLLGRMLADQKSLRSQGQSSSGSTTDLETAASVFKFAADNSIVEWKLDVYDDNGQKIAIVATSQKENEIGKGESLKKDLSVKGDKIVDIHSHPSSTGTQGGSEGDMKNADPRTKNAVYFKGNSTLYEYDQRESRKGTNKILSIRDLLEYIERDRKY